MLAPSGFQAGGQNPARQNVKKTTKNYKKIAKELYITLALGLCFL